MLTRLLALLAAWRWDRRILRRAFSGDSIFHDAPDAVVDRWAAKHLADVRSEAELLAIQRARYVRRERAEQAQSFWRAMEAAVVPREKDQ